MIKGKLSKQEKMQAARLKVTHGEEFAAEWRKAMIDARTNKAQFDKKPVNFMTTALPPLKPGQEKYV